MISTAAFARYFTTLIFGDIKSINNYIGNSLNISNFLKIYIIS